MNAAAFEQRRPWATRHPVATALVISLLLHALCYSGYRLAQQLGWRGLPLPRWLTETVAKLSPVPKSLLEKKLQPPAPPEREVPLTFVEVDPSLAVPEPPKDAKYYSTHSTVAANPEPPKEVALDVPKIEGAQTKVVKTVEALKPNLTPLQPAPTPPQEPQPEQRAEQPKPQGGQPIGELAMARPAPSPLPLSTGKAESKAGEANEAKLERPRTVKEALARAEGSRLAGEKIKQEGGVRNLGIVALDVKSSIHGEYDAALIAAVQKRWFDIIGERPIPAGTVVIQFRLHYDGRISDLKLIDQDVGDLFALFCEKAIQDPAPFARWPLEMRRKLGVDYMDRRFSFLY
ncbi:MAG: hypothetical protein HY300_20460 [Verrucomicrobia bacterium]|nr:hypothetical protein [Verrucomicrobiota bacterium]